MYDDHKTLEQILKKPLLAAPIWLQRMVLNLQWYDCKSKEMYLPDALSRAYLPDTSNPEITDLEQVSTLDFLSITKHKYTESFMMVGTDLFDVESKTYLLTVDFYWKFTEVDRLRDLDRTTIE